MGILSWIVVGAIAGWLAGMLVKGDEGLGVIGKIVLGIIGAVVGGFVAGLFFPGRNFINDISIETIVVATIGAIIVVVGYHFLTGRSRTGRGAI
ncbi:MAG: GlsB/YeaQ/YmgE family stress response membrane protein [Chloroflexota bacterium]